MSRDIWYITWPETNRFEIEAKQKSRPTAPFKVLTKEEDAQLTRQRRKLAKQKQVRNRMSWNRDFAYERKETELVKIFEVNLKKPKHWRFNNSIR